VKLLLDENLSQKLRKLVPGHDRVTTSFIRWTGAKSQSQTPPGLRPPICLVAGALVFTAICMHRFGLNGTAYHRWLWRDAPGGWRYPVFAALALPFFAGQWLWQRHPQRIKVPLLLVMLSSASLMVALVLVQGQTPSLGGIIHVIQSPTHFGYFYDAERLLEKGILPRQMLAEYSRICGSFSLHPRIKPPGLMLINSLVVTVFGSGHGGQIAVACLIGLGAALGVPAVYFFVAEFTGEPQGAFAAAGYFALCPGLLLMFPQFDQCYPLLTVALAIAWKRALVKNSPYLAVQFGLIFAITLFITYLPAVLVLFFGGYAVILKWQRALKWRQAMRLACVAVGAFVAFYAVVWIATGFNPIASFRACWANQAGNMRILESLGSVPRRWPGTIPGDFSDFALGCGWIAYLLAGMFFLAKTRASRPPLALGILCLAQLAMVGLLGLIRCETARVWIFMLPLLMLPAGLELSRWPFAWRMAIYAALLVLVIGTWHSMTFFR
jgi:hypothetical protein